MSALTVTWQIEIERKLDRLLNDLDFIKNRVATYLGRNEALTYLIDETPIFVNTDDVGCPLNFLNGRRYEEEYFSVLLSFRKPRSNFLDIGANLGVYSLRMGGYLRRGTIKAFEPIARVRDLLSRSVFLNGYDSFVTVQPYALSDQNGEATLSIPAGHAGGASLSEESASGEKVQIRKLDDLVDDRFVCDMVKLDVEGHEFHAMRGMRQVMERSPNSVVMFEKLAASSGIESPVLDYAGMLSWSIYHIQGTKLIKCDVSTFRDSGGYFVAGRNEVIEKDGIERAFFDIYPDDFNVLSGDVIAGVMHVRAKLPKGTLIFHGPYWFLSRGYYRMTIDGEIDGVFDLDLTERFGYKVLGLELKSNFTSIDFSIYRDLCKFELVLRVREECSTIQLNKIRFTRLG